MKPKENKETSMVWELEPEVWIQLRPITTHYTECEESYYLATHQTVFNSNLPESKRKVRRKYEPKFMALRAFGRSSVMTATPLGKTFPLTNSSSFEAMVASVLREGEVLKALKPLEKQRWSCE